MTFKKTQVSKFTSGCEVTQSCVAVQAHRIKLLYLLIKQIHLESWCFLWIDFYHSCNSLLLVFLLKVIPYQVGFLF